MTTSYNPILSKEELSRWGLLNKIPIPDANTALVFVGNGEPTMIITEGQKGLTRGEIVWGKYSLVYKVDLSDFTICFECKLPCVTDAFDFQAEVTFTCSVREPEIIVRRNVRNIYSVLQPFIIDEMRRISRKYELEEIGVAEKEISDNFKIKIYDIDIFNFRNLYIRLSLEAEARKLIRRKKILLEEHELEIIRFQQEVELQTKRNQQECQEIKLSLLEEMEIQMLRQNLQKQKMQFEEEQVQQQNLFHMEMIKERDKFYKTIPHTDKRTLFALPVAQRLKGGIYVGGNALFIGDVAGYNVIKDDNK
ncbi:SPFH domain-containing protein [Nostoc sp. UHCC 0870]|uniref:SPFH domain-containing protein n=1 Tax=Nostoc sp. UHCC 0870 TaxID=2914041 RepID=UPI001EDF10BB|nr:SPFH domain-containing protein [Nostoc sp. UHCC 0870]UKP00518.1 SPFH domain-containing protein [Nostoc sp. UHCC 0870]